MTTIAARIKNISTREPACIKLTINNSEQFTAHKACGFNYAQSRYMLINVIILGLFKTAHIRREETNLLAFNNPVSVTKKYKKKLAIR